MKTTLRWAAALAMSLAALAASAAEVAYRTLDAGGVNVFYREAGDADKPALLLLHGFPASSQMFEGLMRELGDHYHLVAPDYPGSGHGAVPGSGAFTPTFDGLADVMERFVEKKGLSRFALYMQDFGGPVGFRLAARHPERVTALIVQNANAYEEGLSQTLKGHIQFMKAGVVPKTRPVFDKVLGAESVHHMFADGARRPERLNPDSWTLASAALADEANRQVQMQLLADYHSNVAQYPAWQAYLRTAQPPTLVVWGKNDSLFVEAGAKAFARDLKQVDIHLLDAGHFALQEETDTIARLVRQFLGKPARSAYAADAAP